MATNPLFLSPALPAELLTFIVNQTTHPTTLIICSSQTDFLTQVIQNVRGDSKVKFQLEDKHEQDSIKSEPEDQDILPPTSTLYPQLISAPLYRTAIARHIRIVFMPTVIHLRAFLSVFPATDSEVPSPPPAGPTFAQFRRPPRLPLLLVFGFLDLHRHTSEWTAQGLNNTAATLVEVAKQGGFRPVIVEPRGGVDGGGIGMEGLLEEGMPVISGTRRTGEGEEGGCTGRKVAIRRVLGRWFGFEKGSWDTFMKIKREED